ncbi:MAG: 4Fe-4S binding protein [Candidatus Adiutrix sp.]|jgi:ferredoxin|nr:4Fe-4S binding protein [Candidatus Adiutrix sp.]
MNRKTWRLFVWVRRLTAWGLLALMTASILRPEDWPAGLALLPNFQYGQLVAGFFSGSPRAAAALLVMSLLTILGGRWFCGFICPLGAAMDLAGFIRSRLRPQKFSFKKSRAWRALVPGLTLVLFWLGLTLPFGLLEPYSQMVSVSLFHAGPGLITAAVILAAFLKGRGFCNSLCPTGLILRLLSRSPVLTLRIDPQACLGCGGCRRVCPASCLDSDKRRLDHDRCLVCLSCAPVCPKGAISFGRERAEPFGRRGFLRLAGVSALAGGAFLTSQEARAKLLPGPSASPILPPGALSLAHLNAHCSLCHTCVRACPNQALRPSPGGGLLLYNKPILDPYQGFCQYDCTVCTRICPTGALQRLSLEEKRLSRLGLVSLDRLECVVVKNGTSCGACAELCPTGAVGMAPGPSGRDEPSLEQSYCIGCGACQKACPVRPRAAIWVDGLPLQQTARAPRAEAVEDAALSEEFPF